MSHGKAAHILRTARQHTQQQLRHKLECALRAFPSYRRAHRIHRLQEALQLRVENGWS